MACIFNSQSEASAAVASRQRPRHQSTRYILSHLATTDDEEDAASQSEPPPVPIGRHAESDDVTEQETEDDDDEAPSSSQWLWLPHGAADTASTFDYDNSSSSSCCGRQDSKAGQEFEPRSVDSTACRLSDASAMSSFGDEADDDGADNSSTGATTERTEEVMVKASPLPLRRAASAGDVGVPDAGGGGAASETGRPRFWKTLEVRHGSDADLPQALAEVAPTRRCLSSYFVQVRPPPLPPQPLPRPQQRRDGEAEEVP